MIYLLILGDNVVMYSTARRLHAPISSSYNTGYQIYKKRISFTLVVDAFHVCDDDSVNEIFSTEISEICVKKCPLRSVKDNVSDASFSVSLFTPSDTVAYCHSEDLVTIFEAITA